MEFSALRADDFYECFFVVPGSTPVEQTNLAMVWWQSCCLDHSHAVFSNLVVLGLPVCACIGQGALSRQTQARIHVVLLVLAALLASRVLPGTELATRVTRFACLSGLVDFGRSVWVCRIFVWPPPGLWFSIGSPARRMPHQFFVCMPCPMWVRSWPFCLFLMCSSLGLSSKKWGNFGPLAFGCLPFCVCQSRWVLGKTIRKAVLPLWGWHRGVPPWPLKRCPSRANVFGPAVFMGGFARIGFAGFHCSHRSNQPRRGARAPAVDLHAWACIWSLSS
jgi:hypothetical protein